jgi:hypothetical protein
MSRRHNRRVFQFNWCRRTLLSFDSQFMLNRIDMTSNSVNIFISRFGQLFNGRATRINQSKCASIAELPLLPVREGKVVMWHLLLVVKLEECEDFQILGTTSLQILRDYRHGWASTLAADSFFHFFTITNLFWLPTRFRYTKHFTVIIASQSQAWSELCPTSPCMKLLYVLNKHEWK